jgi:protease-4
MTRSALSLLLCVLVSGCSGVRFVIDAVPAEDRIVETTVMEDEGGGWRTGKIAMIDVSGMIANARRPGALAEGENPVARFAETLAAAASDSSVKALILRINSPGGTVTAGRPVVVMMGDVAASGGFYLACAGDEIIAHPTTITGSIGVIMQTFNVSDGMHRIGIHADAITSGENKAMGSPFEPMPSEHRALLQGVVDEFYVSFRGLVAARRPEVSAADLDTVTDGRIVTGLRAAEVGLVDRTGDIRDAFAVAKSRAGLERARLVKYHRPLEYVASPYSRSPSSPAGAQVNLLQLNVDAVPGLGETGFYYLWDPTVW